MEYTMSTITILPSPEPEVIRYASGFWRRFAAFVIDFSMLLAVLSPLSFALGFGFIPPHHKEGTPYSPSLILYGLALTIIRWLYWSLMESSHFQATLGKMAMGLIVTDEYGKRISFARATGREFSKYFSSAILFIGFIMAAFTETNQALHDKVAGTLVLIKNKTS
jgi:uncharacterized RDD family membrane protein YckC